MKITGMALNFSSEKVFGRMVVGVLACGLIFQVACHSNSTKLVGHPPVPDHVINAKIKDISGTDKMDILWVIGGMTEQDANFRAGVGDFMTTFVTKRYPWRMAVVSSNTTDAPFLGMPVIFDNKDPNAVQTLVDAVGKASNGLDQEVVFDPMQYYLSKFPQFLRPEATLVVIMTNDARDQSTNIRSADAMMDFLKSLKGGNDKKVLVYGIFGATDLQCRANQIDENWNFNGSEFDRLISMSKGQVYSLCDASFGTQLAKLGDNLYHRISNPMIRLTTRPNLLTMRVLYHDQELQQGLPKQGGVWYYDNDRNAIIFSTLDFAPSEIEQVVVEYSDYQD